MQRLFLWLVFWFRQLPMARVNKATDEAGLVVERRRSSDWRALAFAWVLGTELSWLKAYNLLGLNVWGLCLS
jgi:hypothetical protein